MVVAYKHEPFTDFSVEANKLAFEEGLKKVESYLGQDYPLIIGGRKNHYRRQNCFCKPCK